MSQRFLHILAICGFLFTFAGCASWTTYPPIPGAAQMGRPDYEPGPAIMAEAIRYTYDRHAKAALPDEEIVFNLPVGIPAEVYERVIRRLGPDLAARPMTAEDERAIHVKSVRIRAFDSEVDVVYPRRDGMHEMIMLSMRQDVLNRHSVRGSRLWRIHVAAPPAHYVPPTPREKRPMEVVVDADPTGVESHEVGPEAQAGAMADDPAADQ